MRTQFIFSLLMLVGVARVHGLDYFLDTTADVTAEWQIQCTAGYHEDVNFDCGLGEGALIPSIDHNANKGFWTRCGGGNEGIDCTIHFVPRAGSETLTKLGLAAYLQGGGRVEVAFEGDRPGTLYVEGNRWTSISNYIDISQYVPFRTLRLSMEFGSHMYFSLIDQVIVTDGGVTPNTTTTAPPPTTTAVPDTTTSPPDPDTTTGVPPTTLPPDTTTDAPPTTTSAPPTTVITTTAPPPTTTPPQDSTPRLCSHVTCGLNGDYPDPQDCTGYVTCSSGIPYCQPCPAGLHYNIVASRCDFPQFVDCGTRPIP